MSCSSCHVHNTPGINPQRRLPRPCIWVSPTCLTISLESFLEIISNVGILDVSYRPADVIHFSPSPPFSIPSGARGQYLGKYLGNFDCTCTPLALLLMLHDLQREPKTMDCQVCDSCPPAHREHRLCRAATYRTQNRRSHQLLLPGRPLPPK